MTEFYIWETDINLNSLNVPIYRIQIAERHLHKENCELFMVQFFERNDPSCHLYVELGTVSKCNTCVRKKRWREMVVFRISTFS